jgi:LicD family
MGKTSRAPCTRFTRECDFGNWGTDSVRPACCTEHLVELMAFTSDLLERHGIVHWLDYGTLLGAVREGELIPWDNDVDFSMLQRQEQQALALAEKIAAAGYRLDTSQQGVIRILYSEVNELHVDLFLWEARGGLLQPLEDISYAWPGMASRLAFPERFIAPIGEISLYGRRFPAPTSVHEFLRDHRYGPGYATPARSIKSIRLYPSYDIEETTPEIERLIARIAAGDQRLAELRSDSRGSHRRAVELWQKAALPISPSPARVNALLAQVGGDSPTATVETLSRSVALVEQAIDELEHRPPGLVIRQAGRRTRRIAEVVAARLQRRPHRAGFPFGAETT